ncbi:MAG: hypothetical protein Q8L14_38470 [Myxococcales bacterium]|nr:hypothetical protein [Myxococcales bacterium]
MRAIAMGLSISGLIVAALFVFRPASPVARSVPETQVGPSREDIVQLARETDVVESRFADAQSECNRRVDADEVFAAIGDTAAVARLRGTRIAQRVTTKDALSFDVSVRGNYRKLMSFLDEVSQWRKLALVKDLRIQRLEDDELNASFVLVVFSDPTRFATAVVNRPN